MATTEPSVRCEMHVGPSRLFLAYRCLGLAHSDLAASEESIQGVVAIDLRSEPLHI